MSLTTICPVTLKITCTGSVELVEVGTPVPPYRSLLKRTRTWVVTCVRLCGKPTKLFPLNCNGSTSGRGVLISNTAVAVAGVAEVVEVAEAAAVASAEVAVVVVSPKLVPTMLPWVLIEDFNWYFYRVMDLFRYSINFKAIRSHRCLVITAGYASHDCNAMLCRLTDHVR